MFHSNKYSFILKPAVIVYSAFLYLPVYTRILAVGVLLKMSNTYSECSR